MFSKACEYAIRAMVYITRAAVDSRVGLREIARQTDVPVHFVAKVLQDLSRKGIVGSVKGPNGGFFLDAASRKRKLIDIVKAIDGDRLFASCGLGIKNCSARRPCPIHFEYNVVRDKLRQMLMENTIEDLAAGLVSGETFLVKR